MSGERQNIKETEDAKPRHRKEGKLLAFHLIAVHGPVLGDAPAKSWKLPAEGVVTIGRDSTCTISLEGDARASGLHAELRYLKKLGKYELTHRSQKNPTDVNGEPVEEQRLLESSDVLCIGSTLLVYSIVEHRAIDASVFESRSPAVHPCWSLIEHVATAALAARLPLFLHGPTGAGKEFLARRAHENSGGGLFIPFLCAGQSPDLIGSALFGHVKGAFTGATEDRVGAFDRAEGGTLLLDELGKMPREQQGLLFRALRNREVTPIGSEETHQLEDLRVVVAAKEGTGAFLDDTLSRVEGENIFVPGLAARREEILPLFMQFAREGSAPDQLPLLDVFAAEALLLHPWPKNVAELLFVAKKVAAYAREHPGEEITPELLPIDLPTSGPEPEELPPAAPRRRRSDPTPEEIEAAIRAADGVVRDAAKALNMNFRVLYKRLKAQGIRPDALREEPTKSRFGRQGDVRPDKPAEKK